MLITENEIRARTAKVIEPQLRRRPRWSGEAFWRPPAQVAEEDFLQEHFRAQEHIEKPDIFLSHRFRDRGLLPGIIDKLETYGYFVFLDWRDDDELNRDHVSAETARKLKWWMVNSKCLLYAMTDGAMTSVWMPWEVGFKDGSLGKVATLPIAPGDEKRTDGREYLGMYPFIEESETKRDETKLYISRSPTCYVTFDGWLKNKEPYEHK